jgi:phosphinothricin acetyltransferase
MRHLDGSASGGSNVCAVTESSAAAVQIRRGDAADLPAVTGIYNQYIGTAITFDLAPLVVSEREAWFAAFSTSGRHQIFVAAAGGSVLGYACTQPFRGKAAYDPSVETSIYLARDAAGLGIGRRLYAALFAGLAGADVHRAYAGITLPNPASIALHESFGFRQLALFSEVGRKHGKYWDVLWLEKPLGAQRSLA